MAQKDVNEVAGGFFIDGLDETPDRVNAEGLHTLQILSATLKEGKDKEKGNKYLLFYLSVSDQPEANDVAHMLLLPNPKLDDKTNLNRRQDIKEFFTHFGIPTDREVDFDEVVGLEAEAYLVVKTDDYGTKSVISRLA